MNTREKRVAELLANVAPLLRASIAFVLHESQRLLDETDPGHFDVVLASTYRDNVHQFELFKRGRKLVDGKWEVVDRSKVVTNARPAETCHCVVDKEDRPAALGADFLIVDKSTNAALASHPLHPAWAVIPFAAFRAPTELAVGAGFRSLQDWGHVEAAGWRSLVAAGKLIT